MDIITFIKEILRDPRTPTWIEGIGTLSAVIVALYLARNDQRIKCLGSANFVTIFGSGFQEDYALLTATNIGTRSFIVSSFNFQIGVFKKKLYFPISNETMLSSKFPAKISDGESASLYLHKESFLKTSIPELLKDKPRYFSNRWVRSIRLIVRTTTNSSLSYKVDKRIIQEMIPQAGA